MLLSALFFTRLFKDKNQDENSTRDHKVIKSCHLNAVNVIHQQLNDFIQALQKRTSPESLLIFRDQLKSNTSNKDNETVIKDGETDKKESETVDHQKEKDLSSHLIDSEFYTLSLNQIPSTSKQLTRVVVYLYFPKTKQYLTVWFMRRMSNIHTWTIEDFYVYQFEEIHKISRTNQDYCHKTFKTSKGRIFYTTDLMIEWILHNRKANVVH